MYVLLHIRLSLDLYTYILVWKGWKSYVFVPIFLGFLQIHMNIPLKVSVIPPLNFFW